MVPGIIIPMIPLNDHLGSVIGGGIISQPHHSTHWVTIAVSLNLILLDAFWREFNDLFSTISSLILFSDAYPRLGLPNLLFLFRRRRLMCSYGPPVLLSYTNSSSCPSRWVAWFCLLHLVLASRIACRLSDSRCWFWPCSSKGVARILGKTFSQTSPTISFTKHWSSISEQ